MRYVHTVHVNVMHSHAQVVHVSTCKVCYCTQHEVVIGRRLAGGGAGLWWCIKHIQNAEEMLRL